MTEPVIIVGGGPVGLSVGLFLTDHDIPVLIIDRHETPFEDPRAATFHPPTLEMLEPSGITKMLHQQGIVVPTWQLWDRTRGLIAEFDLGVLAEDTRFPYRLQCEQHKLAQMLRGLLAQRANCRILTGETVIDVIQDQHGVKVITNKAEYHTQYVVGADGGRSIVRKSQDIEFDGFSYAERFLVITSTYDFEAENFALSCYVSDPEEWCALFKVPGDGPPGVWRIVFPTDSNVAEETLLSHAFAKNRLERFLPRQKPYEITHVNLYKVHQRVASTYRRDRVLLAGDAAHVNNPLGGMGMNFGIHDAFSLGEKLAKVIQGTAGDDLLDLYDRQRRSAATSFLQKMTIDNKKALEEKNEVVAAEHRENMRRSAADPDLAREYLLRTSMIEGLRTVESID